jgi:hypothetical protein
MAVLPTKDSPSNVLDVNKDVHMGFKMQTNKSLDQGNY